MISINKSKCTQCRTCEESCPVMSFGTDLSDFPADCICCEHCASGCRNGAVEINEIEPVWQAQANIEVAEFENLLAQRRTHRDFLNKDVPRDLVVRFISHLRHSPTAGNNQNLQFTVINDRSQIAQLNDEVLTTIKARFNTLINGFTLPVVKAVYGKRYDAVLAAKRKFMKKSDVKHDLVTYNAPLVIIVHAPDSPTGMPLLNAGIWTGMALLYAETLGLGTCVNGYIVNALQSNKKLKDKLGIPKENQVFSSLLMGYSKKKFTFKVPRKEPVVQWTIDN